MIQLPSQASPPPSPQAGISPREECWPPIDCSAPNQFSAGGQAYSATWDPAHITVNSVTSYVRYYASTFGWPYGCVASGGGSDITTQLSLTSWYLYSDNPANYYYCDDDGDGGYIGSNFTAIVNYVIFSNPLFCIGITTWAEYYPQEIDGNSDGSLDAYYLSIISGSPCAGLLSPQQIQVTRLF